MAFNYQYVEKFVSIFMVAFNVMQTIYSIVD